MSDYGSVDDIRRKIREGIYTTATMDSARNELWKFFVGVSATVDGEVTKIPYVSCIRCNTVLTYNSKTGGTSHLRRHVDGCGSKTGSSSCPGIGSFFKSSGVPASVKSDITEKCADFACKDIRPFETVSGVGFIALAQSLINIGVKHGQVSASDVLPHPTTVSRRVHDVAEKLKKDVVQPEIEACIKKWGGASTTDMWTESYTQSSYITVTVHYVTENWNLVERVLATREFDPEARHTGVNIRKAVLEILTEFTIPPEKLVFVTDRGANVLAALKEYKHLSCCDHIINTILSHTFDARELDTNPEVRSLLSASKELVRYFKKSSKMKLLRTSLKQEVSTRWNTMFALLESVLANFDQIEHVLRVHKEEYRYYTVSL
jgi:uncharacterized protein involved in tolerance to divalent cations